MARETKWLEENNQQWQGKPKENEPNSLGKSKGNKPTCLRKPMEDKPKRLGESREMSQNCRTRPSPGFCANWKCVLLMRLAQLLYPRSAYCYKRAALISANDKTVPEPKWLR